MKRNETICCIKSFWTNQTRTGKTQEQEFRGRFSSGLWKTLLRLKHWDEAQRSTEASDQNPERYFASRRSGRTKKEWKWSRWTEVFKGERKKEFDRCQTQNYGTETDWRPDWWPSTKPPWRWWRDRHTDGAETSFTSSETSVRVVSDVLELPL